MTHEEIMRLLQDAVQDRFAKVDYMENEGDSRGPCLWLTAKDGSEWIVNLEEVFTRWPMPEVE